MSRGRKENASLSFVQSRIYRTRPLKKGYFRVHACERFNMNGFVHRLVLTYTRTRKWPIGLSRCFDGLFGKFFSTL